MPRPPNGLRHILNEDEAPTYVEVEVRNCRLKSFKENGRYYQVYQNGICLFPCDKSEHDRQDMLHWCIYGILLRHLHPEKPTVIQEDTPQLNVVANVIAQCNRLGRVLDIGCGTGIWALDIADRYAASFVEGIDIVGAQPTPASNTLWRTPRSGDGAAIDFEQPAWPGISPGVYDLIHANQLCGSISNWTAFLSNCFAALTPGGHFESFEIDFEPCCDDNSLPQGSALHTWWSYMLQAMQQKPLDYQYNMPSRLANVGFTDTKRITIPLPANSWVDTQSSASASAWVQRIMMQSPNDRNCAQLWLPAADWVRRVKDVAQYMPLVLQNSPELPFVDTFGGLTMGPLTRNLGWSKAQVDRLIEQVMACCSNPAYHVYFKLHILVAQKPG